MRIDIATIHKRLSPSMQRIKVDGSMVTELLRNTNAVRNQHHVTKGIRDQNQLWTEALIGDISKSNLIRIKCTTME